jgi:hypothetical protein
MVRVTIVGLSKAPRQLDDRYLASESAIDLRKFETDVAAAKDDEMRRKEIDIHHRAYW